MIADVLNELYELNLKDLTKAVSYDQFGMDKQSIPIYEKQMKILVLDLLVQHINFIQLTNGQDAVNEFMAKLDWEALKSCALCLNYELPEIIESIQLLDQKFELKYNCVGGECLPSETGDYVTLQECQFYCGYVKPVLIDLNVVCKNC